MKITEEEIKAIKSWRKAKTKVRNVYKIEEDGSKTQAIVLDTGDKAVFHNEKGPALINKKQRRKEYYLNGIEYDYEAWSAIIRGKEGLPWYKIAAGKGTSRH